MFGICVRTRVASLSVGRVIRRPHVSLANIDQIAATRFSVIAVLFASAPQAARVACARLTCACRRLRCAKSRHANADGERAEVAPLPYDADFVHRSAEFNWRPVLSAVASFVGAVARAHPAPVASARFVATSYQSRGVMLSANGDVGLAMISQPIAEGKWRRPTRGARE